MSPKNEENDIFANIPRGNTPPKEEKTQPKIIEPKIEDTPPPQSLPSSTKMQHSLKEKTLRIWWTITALISMVVNIVVIAIVIILVGTYSKANGSLVLPKGINEKVVVNLLQGLYDNFQKMDEAHIKTDIVVEDTIPVQFDLQLNQPTVVTLTEAVTIYGAYVEINTGALNISAPATVVLPEGLDLPILLNLTVPVNTTIPVKLNVAVDIPLEETDLHEPFVGLQDVVQPLYCLVAPKAQMLNGGDICP